MGKLELDYIYIYIYILIDDFLIRRFSSKKNKS